MPKETPLSGTVLAIDYGLKRLGLACGDASVKITHPLATISETKKEAKLKAIGVYIREWRPVALAVGLPLKVDGSESEVTRICRNFAEQLSEHFSLPVYLIDERYSSCYAEELLAEQDIKGPRQKLYLDQVAAQAILTSFFSDGYQHKIIPAKASAL